MGQPPATVTISMAKSFSRHQSSHGRSQTERGSKTRNQRHFNSVRDLAVKHLKGEICFQTLEKLGICNGRVTVTVDQRTPLLSLHLALLGRGKPGGPLHQRAILLSPPILCQTLPPTQVVKPWRQIRMLTCVRGPACRRFAQCPLFCQVLMCPKRRAQIHHG